MVSLSGRTIRPRSASSKSDLLPKGSDFSTAAFAALVASVAGLGWVCAHAAVGTAKRLATIASEQSVSYAVRRMTFPLLTKLIAGKNTTDEVARNLAKRLGK